MAGAVTVNSGVTLSISSGATVKFPPNSDLIVNGVLHADGATFTSTSGSVPGSWGCIKLNESGAAGSTLNDCTIEYGDQIQTIDVPGFTIDSCTIRYLNTGVDCSGGYGWITYNHIENPAVVGVNVHSGGNVSCYYNTITTSGQTGYGIYFGSDAQDYVLKNEISGFLWGFTSAWGARAMFGHPSANTPPYNNYIHDCYYGVSSHDYSELIMGDRYNRQSIYRRSVMEANAPYHAYAATYGDIEAPDNWWDPDTPARFYHSVDSDLIYLPVMPGPPPLKMQPGPEGQQIASSETGKLQLSMKGSEGIDDPFEQGRRSKDLGNKTEALSAFKEAVAKGVNATQSLLEIRSLCDDTLSTQVVDYLKSLPSDQYPLASYLTGNILAKEDRFDEALDQLSRIPSSSTLANGGKLSAFYIQLYGKGNATNAKMILDELAGADFAGGYEYAHARHDFAAATGGRDTWNEWASIQKDTAANEVPVSLAQNSPNPFNPSTIINFSLASPGLVSLKVYDMLGREIAVLVNKVKNKGTHRVQWDASKCASGVYFARIDAAGKTAVRKLLLVK